MRPCWPTSSSWPVRSSARRRSWASSPWRSGWAWRSWWASAGEVLSDATIRWRDREIGEALQAATGLPVKLDADVRAAARGEAHLGAGRLYDSFLYVTVGTGISASLVIDRTPYAGARGLTGTFASSRGLIPGDDGRLVSGPAAGAVRRGAGVGGAFGRGPGRLHRHRFRRRGARRGRRFARAGNSSRRPARRSVQRSVNWSTCWTPRRWSSAAAWAWCSGLYRESLEAAMREHIWSDLHRDLPLLSAELGNDAGFIGAAFGACRLRSD